jgi:MSHA pilin protein MshC
MCAPGSPRASRRQLGFTLVELLVTISILSILAIAVLPRFFDRSDFDNLKTYDQALAAMRYAQKVAIAQRRSVFVRVVSPTLAVCFDAGCSVPVRDPASGNPLVVSAADGVALNASPSPTLSFSALGAADTALVVQVGDRSFSVELETGHVHP